MIEVSKLIPNPDNARDIEREKFDKLCESIKRDPEFMVLNPLKIVENGLVLAGNMRLRAIRALEMKKIPDNWVEDISHLSKEKRRRYIVIDNLMYGFYEWDILTGQYSEEELIEWGVDLPVEPLPGNDEPVPDVSHGFKIQCDNLDELIELRELLDAEEESKSMSFANFRMIFQNRIT